MKSKYVIGVDYGTLSARAIVVDAAGVKKDDIIALDTDFTASTTLPVDDEGLRNMIRESSTAPCMTRFMRNIAACTIILAAAATM